ncbi:MAG: divergent polysaccharide deacetylase family protein, partial [Alphaproteobacteria bacterium]|nr:divergent polysaccharide deacetylase family protein [Alphaproteobacteria bacterium]
MKSISKGLIFTYFLLAIALVEGLVVIYDLLQPAQTEYKLATAELSVPARKIVVPPMLFEQHSAEKIAAELDTAVAEYVMQANLMRQVASEAANDGSESTDAEANEVRGELVANGETAISESVTKEAPKAIEKQEKAIIVEGKKYIAIVIDDLGVSPQNTKAVIDLKKPMTASFLPYAPANKEQVRQAKAAGFEVMLHVPMMPHRRAALAPVTLAPEMDKETVQKHFRDFLAYYDGMGLQGVNNHMGSAFTESSRSLGYVMEIMREKGLYFLDSKT